MTLLADAAIMILREAVSSEHGIQVLVETSAEVAHPALRARQVLYRFKNENGEFANLHIKLHPDEPTRRLWVMNGPLPKEPQTEDENAC